MIRNELIKVVRLNSKNTACFLAIMDAVDAYLSARNKAKPDVSGALPLELIEWWEGLRPEGWDVIQHLSNPYVNCQSEREQKLAIWISCRLLVSNGVKSDVSRALPLVDIQVMLIEAHNKLAKSGLSMDSYSPISLALCEAKMKLQQVISGNER